MTLRSIKFIGRHFWLGLALFDLAYAALPGSADGRWELVSTAVWCVVVWVADCSLRAQRRRTEEWKALALKATDELQRIAETRMGVL